MIRLCVTVSMILVAVGLFVLALGQARGDDWVFYGGSRQEEVTGSVLRDWYALNRLKPVPRDEAATLHFYDQDSVASNAPFGGGIVRFWEKAVLQKDTKTYEESKEEIEKEEARSGRRISALDYAWLFPHAVNRATKEIETLYEINCDTKEFFLMEVNSYDKEGSRMTRQVNPEMGLWPPIQPGTLMELLSREVCKE